MLTGKIIVVTGGAGLLGREFVQKIAESCGYTVIAEVNEILGKKVKDELNSVLKSDNVDFYPIDITSKESIQNLITTVMTKFGKIDAIVNNAYPRNKNYGRHFFDVEYKDFCENVNLHLGGYFLVSQIFAKFFTEQGWGNIINISSIYGVIAPRFEIYEGTKMNMPVEYAVIKSAIIHLTKYLAKYLKDKNIRVNTVSVGGIKDNQPKPFQQKYKEYCLNTGMLNPKDIAGTLIFLLSDLSKFINGQNIIVDDGFTL